MEKYPTKIELKKKDNSQEIPFKKKEEEELAHVKQDLLFEYEELIAYKLLIETLQSTRLFYLYEIISLLVTSIQEEELMRQWYKLNISVILDRL
jgi:hypothetical protein